MTAQRRRTPKISISLIHTGAQADICSRLTNYLLNRLINGAAHKCEAAAHGAVPTPCSASPVRSSLTNKTGALMSYYTSDTRPNELLQHSITQLAISITTAGTIGMMLALSLRAVCHHVVVLGGYRGAGGAGHHQNQQAHLRQPAASDPAVAAIWRR